MTEPGQSENPPIKVCRACSVQSATQGAFCPHCGKAYAGRTISKRSKWIAIGAVVVVIVGGGTAGLMAKTNHDSAVHARHVSALHKAATAAKTRADAQAAAAQRAAAKNAADSNERKIRHELVRQMQATISKDARKDVTSGVLDGPIIYTSCDPLGGGSTDDLTALTTTFQCIAVNKKNDDGTVSGYNFSATANWNKSSYSWRLGS
jgi:hypothetical protein